jgi:hypothetical protein
LGFIADADGAGTVGRRAECEGALGSETFFSVVLRDITHRKSVEEALERALAVREKVRASWHTT